MIQETVSDGPRILVGTPELDFVSGWQGMEVERNVMRATEEIGMPRKAGQAVAIVLKIVERRLL